MNICKKILHRAKHLVTKVAALAVVAVALCLLPSKASAQLTPTTLFTATNLPSVVTAFAISNAQSFVTFPSKTGLSMEWVFNASAGTSNAFIYLYPTIDGTNYASAALFTNGAIAAGTGNVTNTWQWSEAQLKGVVGFQIGISNGVNGTLTNKALRFGKPNP